MSDGRLSRRLAVAVYRECLLEFGATISKEDKEQYADIIEGTLQRKVFKFRVHHTKNGEFSKIDWQKVARNDFQEIKRHFDDIKDDITTLSDKTEKAVMKFKMANMKLKDEACGEAH